MRELAAYVETRAREIDGASPGQDPAKVLALAALYIADEMFRLRDERAEGDKKRASGERSAPPRRKTRSHDSARCVSSSTPWCPRSSRAARNPLTAPGGRGYTGCALRCA